MANLLLWRPPSFTSRPHPDDEAVGCPGALLHLRDRGWTVVSVIASLGFEGQ